MKIIITQPIILHSLIEEEISLLNKYYILTKYNESSDEISIIKQEIDFHEDNLEGFLDLVEDRTEHYFIDLERNGKECYKLFVTSK